MKKTFYVTSISLLILFILACASFQQYGKLEKSARQNYQTKNYDLAVYQCANSLRLNPKYEKAQLLIQDAFKTAVLAHESRIEELKGSSSQMFKWDDVVAELQTLIKLNDTIKQLPGLINKKTGQEIKIETQRYDARLSAAKNNAAEAHYQEGLKLSEKQGLDIQKKAAKEFKAAQEFVFGYKDAAEKYEICRKAGIKRMAIIPFDNKSGKTEYGAMEEMITDNIISDVMGDPSAMEFLEIISRDQLMQVMEEQKLGLSGVLDDKTAIELGKVLGVHELVTGKISQIAYTRPRTATSTYQDVNEVVVGEEKYVDKNGKTKTRPKWGKVAANITKYVKTASASISGSYNIIDVATARIKKSESFKGNSSFNDEWGVYRGDQRALSRYSQSLCSKTESFPPGPEEMVNNAANDLSRSLANTFKEYAR